MQTHGSYRITKGDSGAQTRATVCVAGALGPPLAIKWKYRCYKQLIDICRKHFFSTTKNEECVTYAFMPSALVLVILIVISLSMCSVLMAPYDLAEAAVLDSLISKAMLENNRYRKPKREAKPSSDYADWMWYKSEAVKHQVAWMPLKQMVQYVLARFSRVLGRLPPLE
jgi:hypothetical protein